jgi:hypothetical protein
MYRLTEYFGWMNAVPGLLTLLVLPFITLPGSQPRGSWAGMLILHLVVSAALVFASRQKQSGADIGHKAYPACLVAYGLFILMAYRWLFGGV